MKKSLFFKKFGGALVIKWLHHWPWQLRDVMESRSEVKQGHYEYVLCMYESFLLCRDVYLMPRTKFGSNTMLNILIAMCYTMLYMLEWMWKGKHRIGTSRTQGLHGSALLAYIHGRIP